MKNKKNIDRFFQEKFKDFETEPHGQAWLNIKAALEEQKEEKKGLPIWYKYTGIAAALLLCFFAFNFIYKTSSNTINPIVLDPKIVTTPSFTTDSISTNTIKDEKKLFQNNKTEITLTYDDQPKVTQDKLKSSSKKTKTKINISKTQKQSNVTVYQTKHDRLLNENYLRNENTNADLSLIDKSIEKNEIATESVINRKNNEVNLKTEREAKMAQSKQQEKKHELIVTPNELEELLQEKEKIAGANTKNKWEIIPNIAAIYSNTNARGSTIDPQLSKNKKTADKGFSIGIGINYTLSNKIVLRSGINAFSVGYNTNDVFYAAGLNTKSLANVNFTSNESIEIQSPAKYNAFSSFEKDLQKTSTGSINQKMGYYEVPLELSYAVLDKKLGINIIGGFSTLFLKQNEISLVSSQANLKLGEANNLNSIHFSTNFGLGFEYEFVKSFQINFEPMIKYQLNSYSNDSSNFNPIYIGLYSGVSYRF